MSKQDRDERSIEDIERASEAEASVPAPGISEESGRAWSGHKREIDEHSSEDRQARVRLYKLHIGTEPLLEGGKPNPAFRKLALDQDLALGARDLIRCYVLERRRTRLAQVPYKKRTKLPNDDPWARYLGYSFDGKRPAIDTKGNFLPMCLNKSKGKPYAICSRDTRFESGEVQQDPLDYDITAILTCGKMEVNAVGECPMGRWGNSLTDEDAKASGIGFDDTPSCDKTTALYCWDADLNVPFVIYHARTSLSSSEEFIASCVVGVGDEKEELPLYAFEAHIIVDDRGNYAIPRIVNTNRFSPEKKVLSIVGWWKENRGILVRNLVLMIEADKEKDKFDPEK